MNTDERREALDMARKDFIAVLDGSGSQKEWPGPRPEIAPGISAEVHEADVVVVGGGHAGTQLALAAAEKGASVLVVDKQRQDRYMYVGEQFGCFNSEWLVKRGYGPYDLDQIIREFCKCGVERVDPAIIAAYVKNSGEMMDHLFGLIDPDSDLFAPDQMNIHEAYGKPAYPIELGGYRTWAATVQFRGSVVDDRDALPVVNQHSRLPEVVGYAKRRAEALGARWFYGYSAAVLEQTETGGVTGLAARGAGGRPARFLGRRGVALTCGNFSDIGHRMGVWAGGYMENVPFEPCPQKLLMNGGCLNKTFIYSSCLKLNRKGERFMDESIFYGSMPGIQRQPAGRIFMVTDAKWLEQLKVGGVYHGAPDFGRPEYIEQMRADMGHVLGAGPAGYSVRDACTSEREQGVMYGAMTLDGLADMVGVTGGDRDRFLASVRRYNRQCYAGRDDSFGKDRRAMIAVDTPPYYGGYVEISPPGPPTHRYASPFAGLMCDRDLNVLDIKGDPIDGLFAAGNCMGGRFAVYYPTPCAGVFIGSAMTLGRVLGKHMADLPARW